jgi:hypothetical protein
MKWWFSKPKPKLTSPSPPKPKDDAQDIIIRDLEARLHKLEQHLSDMASKRPEIHIENLHMHQPVLENLTFRMDQLDIHEVSGSLNLGNNFGAKIHPQEPTIAGISEEAKTATGLKFKMDRKPTGGA